MRRLRIGNCAVFKRVLRAAEKKNGCAATLRVAESILPDTHFKGRENGNSLVRRLKKRSESR